MKKYRQKFSKTTFVIYCVVNIVSVLAIVFASIKLAGVGNFASYFPFVDIANIVIFTFFMTFTGLLLFNSWYRFEERGFVIHRGFTNQVISRETITKLIYDEAAGVAALYYVNPLTPDVARYVVILISKKNMDDFIADLRSFKTDVIIDVNPEPPTVNG